MRTTLALLLLCPACFLRAQDHPPTLHVEVQSAAGPVEGASVTISGITTRTTPKGTTDISVRPGNLEITVRKDGFPPAKTSFHASEDSAQDLIIELQQDEKLEQQITVYATRTDLRLEDTPIRVEILDQEEIEEKTMMTPGNIVMMLNETSGIRVQTTSPSLGAASIRIQGMRGRYTRFLTDGLPLNGSQGGGLGLLQIPPLDLAQVEVIKGVASALYGAGAMGGVVNLISRRPPPAPVYDFLVNRSTRGATDVPLFLSRQISSQWSASLLGGGHWQEIRDLDHDGWADLAAYQRGVVRPRLFWNGGEGRSGFLTSGFTYENRTGGTLPGMVLAATGAPYTEALQTHNYDIGGSVQTLIHNRLVIAARAAASRQNHTHQFGEIRERDRHQNMFGELTVRGTSGANTWLAGIAADRDQYIPRDVPRFAYTYTTPGIFLQDDITVKPWLSISASARADFNSHYGTFFSPRLSALLRWMGWTSRLSAGQGFFAPTPLTEETEAAGLFRLQIPKPLLAERGRSASFDLTRALGPLSTTVTLFLSSIRNPIHVERTTRYQLTNLAQPTENIGLEFLSTLRKKPFSATASYTYVRARERVAGQPADVPLTPRHSAGVIGMWEKENVARIGVEGYYTGTQRLEDNPYRTASQPYVLVGFLAERKLRHFTLFLNAENLTNVRQTRWNPLLRPDRAPDGRWTVDAWAPLDGRVFNGGIRLRF